VPVLILHGREDSLVRFHHAERNFAAARPPKRLVALRGDHNDLPDSSAVEYVQALRRLLDRDLGESR
jgi:fermentation-respiration switch protein FrsA (DUF1100 family)